MRDSRSRGSVGAKTVNSSRSDCEADELQLLERARELEPAALSTLYDRYAPRLYTYVYRRVGDAYLAEDLTAQVFLRMLQAIRDHKAWRTSFSGWLFRIAHNLVADHYRDRTSVQRVSLDEVYQVLEDADGDPVKATSQKLTQERIVRAIRRLTEDQARVIVHRFFEGLSIAATARAMDRSTGAVKALQYRAILALRDSLLGSPDGERSTETEDLSRTQTRPVWAGSATTPAGV